MTRPIQRTTLINYSAWVKRTFNH